MKEKVKGSSRISPLTSLERILAAVLGVLLFVFIGLLMYRSPKTDYIYCSQNHGSVHINISRDYPHLYMLLSAAGVVSILFAINGIKVSSLRIKDVSVNDSGISTSTWEFKESNHHTAFSAPPVQASSSDTPSEKQEDELKKLTNQIDPMLKLYIDKILFTLWYYQNEHFPDNRNNRWTFIVGMSSSHYSYYTKAVEFLIKNGYVELNPRDGHCALTLTKGFTYMQGKYPDHKSINKDFLFTF